MNTKRQSEGISKRTFFKLLGGLGLGLGMPKTVLAAPEDTPAVEDNSNNDIRSRLRRIKSPILVDTNRFKRFNSKNWVFNLLSRKTHQSCLGVMIHKTLTAWPSGFVGKGVPSTTPDKARTQMAFAWGADAVNLRNGAYGEGEENKGALSWIGEQAGPFPVPAHFPPPTLKDPVELTRLAKQMARLGGADLVGICRLNRNWIYSDVQRNAHSPEAAITKQITFEDVDQPQESDDKMVIPDSVQYAIVTAYAMNRTLIQAAPGMLDMVATSLGYSRMSFDSLTLATYIRAQGYIAIPCSNGVGATIPMATEAGLGQAGRGGFLITPEFGPSVRLDKILTNMPLVPDEPIDLGVNEFCLHCKKCARECPSKSISLADRAWEGHTDYSVEGVYKWYIDPEKCLSFWMENGNDCAVCIAVCPYTKGDLWAHKITEWSIKHIPVADGIWLTLDDDLHYGARRDGNEVMRDLNMSPYGVDADKFCKERL